MDHMHLVLPTTVAPIRILLDEPLSDDDLLWMCEQNEVFHVEREPVEVYRRGREVEVVAERVDGDGPVAGFVLELGKVWG